MKAISKEFLRPVDDILEKIKEIKLYSKYNFHYYYNHYKLFH